MDLDAYIAERRGEWARLDVLAGKRVLSASEADELVLLHQRVSTHLSVLRGRTPDPMLIARLSRLVLASRAAVTGGRRFSWARAGRFLTTGFAVELYRTRRWWIAVSLLSVLATGVLMAYAAGNPEFTAAFVADRNLTSDFVGYYSEYQAQNFAAQVWTNNALVAAQCLAAGILILPVLWVLGTNLFNVALIGGALIGGGDGGTFFGYLLPHGLLELTAVFVAAGAGLRVGWAWIAPGPDRTRGRAVIDHARSAMLIAVGLVPVLLVSGLVEAFVTPAPLPAAVRVGAGAVVWLLFLGYALGVGAAASRHAGVPGPDADRTRAELQSRPDAFSAR